MKKLFVMLLAVLLLALPAMAEEDDPAQRQAAANAAYARVLLEGEDYIPMTDEARMPAEWKAVRFTVLDMDGDGVSEVVVELTEWEAFVVLFSDGGDVYGGEVVYRGLMNLKDDGTFTFSSGAMDSGVAQLTIRSGGSDTLHMGYLPLAESRTEEDGSVSYWLDGGAESTDEAGYLAALDQQDAKLDALWYDFTPENIRMLLGQ
ncbi:MAG: hypothetical protein IJE07_01390 [Clostridia bacterium]|nr:hypothetical protein [Clostridia bacterium]